MTNTLKKIDWLATIIYPLTVILMEAFWLYPLLVWIGFWPFFTESRPVLSILSIIIVLAVSLLITRVISKRDWQLRSIQAVIIGAGVITMFLVLRIDYSSGYAFFEGGWFAQVGETLGATFDRPSTLVPAIPALIYLWWRGIQLGRTTSYFSNIYRSFIIGMVSLIILIVLWKVSSSSGKIEGPISDIGLYVIAFFFFGLIAMAVCHLHVMRRRMPPSDTTTSVWRSLPIMLGVIGGIIVVGFVVTSLLSSDFYSAVGNVLGVVWHALYTAFVWVMERLNFIFEGIFWVIRWFLSLLRNTQQQEQEGEPGGSPFEGVEPGDINLPEAFTVAFQWFVIAAIVAVVVYILARAISRYRAKRGLEDIEEIHESLWSAGSLRDDLRQFLDILGNRFKRKPKKAGVVFDDTAGRLNVREIYKRLLWEASLRGVLRRKYETPVEYERRLEKYIPEGAEQLAEITDLYSEVRYGDIEPREEKVDNANGLWSALRGMVRRIGGG
jgi:hypothetical protein